MDDSKLKRQAEELSLIEPVQVSLDGWELYSLCFAVQMLKLVDGQRHPKIVETAEAAAKKMFDILDSPLAREHLVEGWKLIDEKLADSPNKQNL
jgi:hypothetical protein